MDAVTGWQRARQKQFKEIPKEGIKVEYLNKEFIVHNSVFIPCPDSMPLVENFKINKGESVLDVCTGSGVIAVFAAYKGAGRVLAIDINPEAAKTVEENAYLHGFSDAIETRVSDMFENVQDQFDVITGNLPFRNKAASDYVEASMWDTDLNAHKKYFSGVSDHLKEGGRIYLAQASFGAVDEMKRLAKKAGFRAKLIGSRPMAGLPESFLAFELVRV